VAILKWHVNCIARAGGEEGRGRYARIVPSVARYSSRYCDDEEVGLLLRLLVIRIIVII